MCSSKTPKAPKTEKPRQLKILLSRDKYDTSKGSPGGYRGFGDYFLQRGGTPSAGVGSGAGLHNSSGLNVVR